MSALVNPKFPNFFLEKSEDIGIRNSFPAELKIKLRTDRPFHRFLITRRMKRNERWPKMESKTLKISLLSFIAGVALLMAQYPVIGSAQANTSSVDVYVERDAALVEHYRDDLAPPMPGKATG
ncbi:hypothetical protein [Maricaulis sp. CAU 1757]